MIYLYVPEVKWFFMLDIYSKNEKEDLSSAEKKELARLVEHLKRQARRAATLPKPGERRSRGLIL